MGLGLKDFGKVGASLSMFIFLLQKKQLEERERVRAFMRGLGHENTHVLVFCD